MTAPAALTGKSRSDGQPDWLLPTKLSAPPPRPHLIARPRLLRRLDEAPRHPLTLITAPAGFGKTTLLSAWRSAAAVHGVPFAWLSLDEADDEPTRFWSYVLAALQQVDSGLGDAALASLRSPQPPPVEAVLGALLRDLAAANADVLLIIDDFHLVEQDAIHRELAFFVDHLPPGAHVVISGRADPPLPLARLRAGNQLLEIRTDDLRFSGDEVSAFLGEVMRLDLSADLMAALATVTEGWAAGLQLAGLSLQQRADPAAFINSFTGSHHYVLDYLVEEVLQRQSPRVQAFLLQTAVLERMSGPLCDAVTGETDGQAMLQLLERSNLFLVPLGEERRWYRYHRLFADVLRQRLFQTRPDVAELHRRAARWSADNGFTEAAIRHALAAGEQDQACRLVEVDGRRLLQRGELATLASWLRVLPPGLVRSRPRLALLQAWLAWVSLASSDRRSTLDERRSALESWVDDAERLLGASSGPAETGSSEAAALRGEAAVLRSHLARARDDLDLATNLSQQALDQVPADEGWVRGHLLFCLGVAAQLRGDLATASRGYAEATALGERAGDPFLALHAAALLAMVYEVQGRLLDAARAQRSALKLATDDHGRRLPVAGLALVGLGRLLREWNDLHGAAGHLDEGLQLLERGAVYGPGARLEHALLLLAQGDVLRASAALDEMVAQAERLNLPDVALRVKAEQVRLWLMHGRHEAAFRWAESSGMREADEPTELAQPAYLTLARVHIARVRSESDRGRAAIASHLQKTLALLARLEERAEAGSHTGRLVEIHALQALAFDAQGDHAQAVVVLARTLAFAEPEGYIRTFVDEGAPMARLLAELTSVQRRGRLAAPVPTPGYVQVLLSAFGARPTTIVGSGLGPALAEPLTQRELEVLRLLAAGLSNERIAHQLVVGRATVKTHVNRIFRKLEASNRVEVVIRARELGVL